MFFIRRWTLKLKWKCYLVLLFLATVTFFWWVTLAERDLLQQTLNPSKELIIYPSENSKRVWNRIFKGQKTVDLFEDWEWKPHTTEVPSLFATITRLFLLLVVTLSVTMILYNWIMYIVKVWQWEDSKNLVKNVAYIVVWILISLFSVVIMTLLRSIPQTIEDPDSGIPESVNNNPDRDAITPPEED